MDFFIIVNLIDFMLFYNRQSATMANVLTQINYALVYIFFIEMMLKIILYGKRFFYTYWNCFELFLLCSALIGLIWNEAAEASLTK
jgi:hypothetical protein